jgi:hypothetical protein
MAEQHYDRAILSIIPNNKTYNIEFFRHSMCTLTALGFFQALTYVYIQGMLSELISDNFLHPEQQLLLY